MRVMRRQVCLGALCSIAAALLVLSACQPVPTPTEQPTVLPTPVTLVPQSASLTVDQVMADWSTSPYLDHIHMEKGLTCQSCHDPFPPKEPPDTSVCLSCHGGNYAAVAKLTGNQSPNPHASHLGELPCTICHGVHTPFEYYCSTCHINYIYSGRFVNAERTPTPTH